jgi:acetolactate synthase-1/2/3 large subunit
VVTTRQGKGGFDARNPLYAGTAWVNQRLRPLLDDADVVLAVGTHLIGHALPAATPVVHLDVDRAEIGIHRADAVPVVGDAAPTLAALLAELRTRRDPAPSRGEQIRAVRATVDASLRAVGPQGALVDQLRAAIPDDGVLVPCTTTIGYMSHMLYPAYGPRTYLSTSYMGTLGWGFPAALGVKVARPDTPVVCATGDGGFLFAATELATAVQYGINTVTVVYNDEAYGNSNRDQRERFGGREIGTALRNPDFVKFAQSFGADAARVAKGDDVGPAVREALGNDRPTVIEVPMDRLPSPF